MTNRELTHQPTGAANVVHRELGPGLWEAVYEECLCFELSQLGIPFEGQRPIPVVYRGVKLDCGYRAHIISKAKPSLRLLRCTRQSCLPICVYYGCPIGLLINFHSAVLKGGIHRYVWHYNPKNEEAERRDAEVTENA